MTVIPHKFLLSKVENTNCDRKLWRTRVLHRTAAKDASYRELEMGNGWWARQDSNLGPMDYESTALTTELRARVAIKLTQT